MRGLLRYLGLRRRVSVTVPVAVAQARTALREALQHDIILSGPWQIKRRYWGHLSGHRLTLNGPIANRQFCFLTRGHLRQGERPDQTQLDLEIVLNQANEIQLLCAVIIMTVMLSVMLRWFGLFVLPLFLAFLYGMTQWHFSCYATEISKLMCDRMIGATHNGIS